MSGRLKGIALYVKYAAIPVQLEIFNLQYTGWCVLILWAFIVNQFSCFCHFLIANFGQSIMSLYILGRCYMLTCYSNVLDCLRYFSTSSAQLIGFWLLQNIFLVVSC